MELEGRVWKDGKFWLVEIPILDAMTQGKSKKDALRMIEDAVTGLIECYFEDKAGKSLGIKAFLREDDVIGVTVKDTKILLSLSLIKQREKSNSTVRDVSKRLGSKSPNAYAQYERGRLSVTRKIRRIAYGCKSLSTSAYSAGNSLASLTYSQSGGMCLKK